MEKVTIMVVEDEIVIADNICRTLKKLGYNTLEPVINYTEAVELLQHEQPDLVLLDIQLAGSKDGIDLAWKIKEDYNIPFIFLTSNADPRTVERAKRLTPPAYLVKPFNKDDLYTSVELALYNHQSSEQPVSKIPESLNEERQLFIKESLFVKDKHLFHKVKLSDIQYVKSEHVYVEIHTVQGKKHLMRSTMNGFSERLPSNFFRVHRSYTINLNHLDTINSMNVYIGKAEIPIGRNYREELLTLINMG